MFPGDPLGGTYSGDGIIGTTFHPGLQGLEHMPLSIHSDGNGCFFRHSFIEVYDDLELKFYHHIGAFIPIHLIQVYILLSMNRFMFQLLICLVERFTFKKQMNR